MTIILPDWAGWIMTRHKRGQNTMEMAEEDDMMVEKLIFMIESCK